MPQSLSGKVNALEAGHSKLAANVVQLQEEVAGSVKAPVLLKGEPRGRWR